MNYGRRTRDRKREERPFAKDWKNESLKESGSSLVQQAGMALGALAAVVAQRLGMPAPAAVVLGSITATTVAIAGKGFVAATVNAIDRRRERKRQNGSGWGTQLVAALNASAHVSSGRSGGSTGNAAAREGTGVGDVVSAIGEAMSQLERSASQLADTANRMQATQNSLEVLLSGARGGMVTLQMLVAARSHVGDCMKMVQQTNQDLRHYLRAI